MYLIYYVMCIYYILLQMDGKNPPQTGHVLHQK